jgi:uncharacterized surface protein with fasciclin (FAS1) repeats
MRIKGGHKMKFLAKTLWVGSVMALLATSWFGSSVKAEAATKDIVDTAVAAGSFTTLAAALPAAGLVETLKVEDLLKPEHMAKLTAILTDHIVSGEVMAAQAATLPSAK